MKIGLVLSGGGARGVAHLGVIQALQEEGITFDAISGVSAGAIAGAFIAAGYQPKEVCGFITKTNLFRTFQLSLNFRSLLRIDKASRELGKYFPEDSFEALNIPLKVTTTDIGKGRVKVYKKGQLILPLLASSCVPIVFDPVRIGTRNLIDGGVLDNLPVDPIKKEVDHMIGLHCNPVDRGFVPGNWRDLLERTMMMTVTQMAYTKKKKLSVFLEPPMVSNYNVFAFNKVNEIFQVGYDYAKEEISKGVLGSLK